MHSDAAFIKELVRLGRDLEKASSAREDAQAAAAQHLRLAQAQQSYIEGLDEEIDSITAQLQDLVEAQGGTDDGAAERGSYPPAPDEGPLRR